MKIVDYFDCENKSYWLEKIGESDWRSGKYLYDLLKSNQLSIKVGLNPQVLMLIDTNELLAFCTLSQKKYDIASSLTPWLGCVYTFPKYRGRRYSEKLIKHAEKLVCETGLDGIYVSTKHIGLYEKYGFSYYGIIADWRNEEQRIYFKSAT